jgi:hypothetical protein
VARILQSIQDADDPILRKSLLEEYDRTTTDIDALRNLMDDLDVVIRTQSKLDATAPSTRGKLPSGGIGNPFVAVRDLTIHKYKDLPGKTICTKLDAELLQRDAPPIGFPTTWEKYGVRTYLKAIEHSRCRNLVEKMISKAKNRF